MNVLREKAKPNRGYITVLHKAELFPLFFFFKSIPVNSHSHIGEHTAGRFLKKKGDTY